MANIAATTQETLTVIQGLQEREQVLVVNISSVVRASEMSGEVEQCEPYAKERDQIFAL